MKTYWTDRRVMITGATGGVGESLAKELSTRGAKLLLTGRRKDALRRLAKALGAEFLVADLSVPEDLTRMTEALEDFGADTLIHNAAIQYQLDFTQDDVGNLADLARREIEVDLSAPIVLTARALPTLSTAKQRLGHRGALVFVTSGLAIAPKQSAPVYCTAKAGLRHFTRALNYQLADAGAEVTAHEVLLPMVETAMNPGAAPGKMKPQDAARQLADGVARGHAEVNVGKTRWLKVIWRLAPSLAYRLLRKMGAPKHRAPNRGSNHVHTVN